MHPMMGKLAHPWGRPIRPSASGRLPHRSHCQCCSRCGSYHRPRCGSHHVRWLVLGFLCLERSWLLIETKMRRIDHKWWDDLIHRLYRNIRSLERNMNNFVGGHARQIIIYIYIYVSLQTPNQDCSHIPILYVLFSFTETFSVLRVFPSQIYRVNSQYQGFSYSRITVPSFPTACADRQS